MFTISNQTDYALLFIEYLARQGEAKSMVKVVDELRLPRRFMAQIAAKLVNANILESREGVNGGYKLSQPVSKIKLYDILALFEGDMALVKCADGEYKCDFAKVCRHKQYWKTVLTTKITNTLNKLTIADVISLPTRHPDPELAGEGSRPNGRSSHSREIPRPRSG